MELTIKALIQKYQAEKAAAIAELNILLNNPAGISEHTNIIQSCDKRIAIIASAEEKIKTINSMIAGQPDGHKSPEQ